MSELVSLVGDLSEWIDKANELVHEALVEATQSTVDQVVELSRELAPVKSGNLRDHIKGEVSAGGHYGRVRIPVKDVPYAPYVLFGTDKMPGNPFIYQAADEVTGGYGDQIEATVQEKATDAGLAE